MKQKLNLKTDEGFTFFVKNCKHPEKKYINTDEGRGQGITQHWPPAICEDEVPEGPGHGPGVRRQVDRVLRVLGLEKQVVAVRTEIKGYLPWRSILFSREVSQNYHKSTLWKRKGFWTQLHIFIIPGYPMCEAVLVDWGPIMAAIPRLRRWQTKQKRSW